jgi:hypothetical protein
MQESHKVDYTAAHQSWQEDFLAWYYSKLIGKYCQVCEILREFARKYKQVLLTYLYTVDLNY